MIANLITLLTFVFVGALMLMLAVLAVSGIKCRQPVWWFCPWCHHWFSDLGHKQTENPGVKVGDVSHGICPDCHQKIHGAKTIWAANSNNMQWVVHYNYRPTGPAVWPA